MENSGISRNCLIIFRYKNRAINDGLFCQLDSEETTFLLYVDELYVRIYLVHLPLYP